MPNAYPADLAGLVLTRWHEAATAAEIELPPPAASTLTALLSICYQATLLREEGRPVTFRLALSEPDAFAAGVGPPAGCIIWCLRVPFHSTSTNSDGLLPLLSFPGR